MELQNIKRGNFRRYTEDAFRQINGYSKEYWGWVGEDDDLYERTISSGFSLMRPEEPVTRYKMIKHEREETNKLYLKMWPAVELTPCREEDKVVG